MPRRKPFPYLKYASITIGAFFCLLTSACDKQKQSTATWENATLQASTAADSQQPAAKPNAAKPGTDQSPAPETTPSADVRFLAYNLRNYLTMRRWTNDKAVYTGKPGEEINALITITASAKPDVLGICEIGTDADLRDFQKRLKAAGTDLPHSHRVTGIDEVRSLAILSRYPIISTAAPEKLGYTLNGTGFAVSRGILDATVQLPKRKVRFLGIHFKSKRPTKEADQEMMRRCESLLLRQHINKILTKSPGTSLLVYGDFNDTKRSKAVYTVKGRANSPRRLETIDVTDSRGELWTHHWRREDIYSRFDFAMATPNLLPHINKQGSKILDPPNWQLASDHRPLLILIK